MPKAVYKNRLAVIGENEFHITISLTVVSEQHSHAVYMHTV